MGVLSDQHNEWRARQDLEARMDADPELRELLAAAWSEGYRAGYDDLWHASGRGTEVREAEAANPYSGHDD